MTRAKFQSGDALLIVDPQYDFLPGGSLAVADGDKIIPIINQWIEAAIKNHIPIIASRDWHPVNHISFKERGGPWPPHCVQNTHGAAFHRDLKLPNDVLIAEKAFDPDHDAYSAFAGVIHSNRVPLPEKLQQLQIKRLWLCGLTFDYCVHFTAMDARQAGYKVMIILPACKAIAAATEQKSFEDLVAAGVVMELDSSPYK